MLEIPLVTFPRYGSGMKWWQIWFFLTWRPDVTMTLFDVKCLIYGKIDVYRNISSCRLHTKLYKLFFLMFFFVSQIDWDKFQYHTLNIFQDGGQYGGQYGGQSSILILLRPDTKDSENSHTMLMIFGYWSIVV